MRVRVYVDGFNLYYGALKSTPFKWLNLVTLAEQVLPPGYKVDRVNYTLLRRQQRAPDGLWLSLDHAQKRRRRTADPPPPLLPFPVAGKAHAHQRRHLGLGEVRMLPNLARGQGSVKDGGALAPCVREGFLEGLDQVFAERAHFLSFPVALSAAASMETARLSSGVMSVFAVFA